MKLTTIAALVGLLAVGGCASKGALPTALPVAPSVFASIARYERVFVVHAGDQLEISVDRLPDLTRTVTVRADGVVTLPRFGEVSVAGLTVPAATAKLTAVFATRVIDPAVTVVVLNPPEDVVFVGGEVGRAGTVPLRQAHSVAEAMLIAGGPTRAAALDRVALIRLDADGHLVAHILERRSKGYAGGYLTMQSVAVQSGDLIIVPESNRSQFTRFIQDFVNTPLNGVNEVLNPYLQYRLIARI